MSIKGGSRAGATKNLDTLVEENADDASSLMLAEEGGGGANRLQANSNDGRSAYETASSKFSTNTDDGIVTAAATRMDECSTSHAGAPCDTSSAKAHKHSRHPSDSGGASHTKRSNLSPRSSKRERLSDHSLTSYADGSLNHDDDYQPAASTSDTLRSAKVQKSFSLRALLNNITAPVRRSKPEKGATTPSKESSQRSNASTTAATTLRSSLKRDSNNESKPLASGRPIPSTSALGAKKIEFFDARDRQNSLPGSESDAHRQLISDFGPIPANINFFRRRCLDAVMKTDKDPPHSEQDDLLMECQVCFCFRPAVQFPTLTNCAHRPCRPCLELYLKIEIMESRVMINCPECSELLHPNDIYNLLCMHYSLLMSYERFMVRRVLMTDPDTRWCPGPDCDYAVIANSCAACPQLECEKPGCGTLFCYHCKGEWHANQTCDEARGKSVERMLASAASALSTNRSGSLNEIVGGSSSSNEQFKPSDLKACPRCRTLILKMNDGSCNHMVCPMCQADFCWLCLKEISDLHYLSPTGCTFWGKKPWTRKKKLLWQIGTLIGAPVGIALIAGLAVPGIICGVPVFVGRKVYQRFAGSSKARRRLLTAASISGALVVSPVLAVLAVGVGVPIMLAYVYGVVPLSLCRNGGCSGSNESNTLENLVEDEEEFGHIASSLREAYTDEEHSRLLRKQFSDMERSSMATRISTNSGFSLNATSSSAAGPSGGRAYGSHGHATQPDILSHSSAKINLMVEQRKRKMSIESNATSLGDKTNYEGASTKAHAGSHYHFDNKSVHTVCSGATEAQSDIQNEENSSIKAMSGSIDGKSLGDSASIRFARQCRANSRPERDLSPSSVYSLNNDPLPGSSSASGGQAAPIKPQAQTRFNGQTLAQLANTIVSDGGALEISSDNIASADNRDPFRVRTLLDNLRQILNDDAADDELPTMGAKAQKKRPQTSASAATNKSMGSVVSVASAASGRANATAKIRYDTHQRALSVQIPNPGTATRRSMPSLAASKEPAQPVETVVTASGTTVIASADTNNKSRDAGETAVRKQERARRPRRLANLFRPFRQHATNSSEPSNANDNVAA